jgi:hypothetical protein
MLLTITTTYPRCRSIRTNYHRELRIHSLPTTFNEVVLLSVIQEHMKVGNNERMKQLKKQID